MGGIKTTKLVNANLGPDISLTPRPSRALADNIYPPLLSLFLFISPSPSLSPSSLLLSPLLPFFLSHSISEYFFRLLKNKTLPFYNHKWQVNLIRGYWDIYVLNSQLGTYACFFLIRTYFRRTMSVLDIVLNCQHSQTSRLAVVFFIISISFVSSFNVYFSRIWGTKE